MFDSSNGSSWFEFGWILNGKEFHGNMSNPPFETVVP